MRDLGRLVAGSAGGSAEQADTPPSLEEIRLFRARLGLDTADADDAARIERLHALEELRCVTEAAQCEVTADFTLSQRAAAAARGVRAERRDRGLGSQVALARRESPHRGNQDVALAMVLRTELPCTRAALRAGRIDRFKATLVARETACLTAEHRATVDERVCGDLDQVEGYSIGDLLGHLTRLTAELEPAAVAERRRRAQADRHTSLRPAPDTMTWFSALLPVKDGVSVQATLDREARRLTAAGDERSLGQIRADLLVARVLGRGVAAGAVGATATAAWTPDTWAPAPDTAPGARAPRPDLPVMINLVVSDDVLLGDAHGTGWVDGHGPVPGDLLREWIAGRLDDQDGGDVIAWIRRVYRQPATGRLVAMDSSAERFTGRLAEFLRLRDRRCRTPWCDAPIRHLDHVVPREADGPTTADNGQGLCEHCNHAKQAHGWASRPRPGPRHTVVTTTPTGHVYVSVAPAPAGTSSDDRQVTLVGYRSGPVLIAS